MLDLLRFRLPQEFDLVVGVKSQMLDWIGEGGAAKLGGGEAGPDSIDVTVDKSVDSSVDSSIDSSIDVDAGDSKIIRLVNASSSKRCAAGVGYPRRAMDDRVCCGTASTASATSATTCPSACSRRCSPA